MQRKAALNLGISTIVVLVIAMVVIGSGISFIRTFFSEGQDALLQTFPASDIGLNPTRDNPFVLGSNELEIQQDSTETIQAAVYNNEGSSVNFVLNITGCIDNRGTDANNITLRSPSAQVPTGESSGFQGILTAQPGIAQNSPFICTAQAQSDQANYTKQVTVEVTT